MSEPNPRELILRLLIGSDDARVSARVAVSACALFGIRENSARVALVRLSADGMIEATGRGEYRVGAKAAELSDDVRSWRDAESRVREEWSGSWVAACWTPPARSDRSALRRRDRAFRLLGFRELERNLFVRPDNLVGGAPSVRERLSKLLLDSDACGVFVASDLDEERDRRARALWDGKKLTKGYVAMRRRLEAWLRRAGALHPAAAARESFLIGDEAIRLSVFDPLLPSPLVDVAERRAFVKTLLRYDREGHELWRKVLTSPSSDDSNDLPRVPSHH